MGTGRSASPGKCARDSTLIPPCIPLSPVPLLPSMINDLFKFGEMEHQKAKRTSPYNLRERGRPRKSQAPSKSPRKRSSLPLSLMSTFALSAAFIASSASSCTGQSLPHLNPHQIQTPPLPSNISVPDMQMLNFSALFSNFSTGFSTLSAAINNTVSSRHQAQVRPNCCLPRFP